MAATFTVRMDIESSYLAVDARDVRLLQDQQEATGHRSGGSSECVILSSTFHLFTSDGFPSGEAKPDTADISNIVAMHHIAERCSALLFAAGTVGFRRSSERRRWTRVTPKTLA